MRRAQSESRVAESLPRDRHDVRPPLPHDAVCLERVSDEANRTRRDPGCGADVFGGEDLIAGAKRYVGRHEAS